MCVRVEIVAVGSELLLGQIADTNSQWLAERLATLDGDTRCTLREAADIMCDRQIRRLPVLNRDKRLIGVITLGDIAERGHDERLAGHALEEVSRHHGPAVRH